MAKIFKKETIQRGNVTTVYKNLGNTPTSSIKDLKQKPVTRSHNSQKGRDKTVSRSIRRLG